MEDTEFYRDIDPVTDFAALLADDRFAPLPSGWVVGMADIVDSTGEIARGRYKTVNMLGASVIAAMTNAMERRPFPYVFGGDGASFAVSAADADRARAVLGTLRNWAAREFGIGLRAALVPVDRVRAAGHDVRVARFAPAPGVGYAMFAGGGLAWAEAQMKQGRFAVPPAAPDALPDLGGLSCRWSNLRARNGAILSLVALPVPGARPADFAAAAGAVLHVAGGLSRGGHPMPEHGPSVRYPPPGLTLEAQASRGRRALSLRIAQLLVGNLIAWLFFTTGLRTAGFDPAHYRSRVTANADFRKFDDGLKLTLDCDAATRDRIRAILDAAQAKGTLRYGLFEQDEAMVTCFVPSVTTDDHVHFVDGAAGGYTRAAAQIRMA